MESIRGKSSTELNFPVVSNKLICFQSVLLELRRHFRPWLHSSDTHWIQQAFSYATISSEGLDIYISMSHDTFKTNIAFSLF
ncbi:unnamed protein product [Adineta ricciae]|uniref:Uncharacterized protein n=1 Tax=Adineta ricciae TaxID=249248 RepID=A0A815FHX5_ADIRI|nr:unnamed protein product [Adineta ricciae]